MAIALNILGYVTPVLHIGSCTRIGYVSDTDTHPIQYRYVSDTPAGASALVVYHIPPDTVSDTPEMRQYGWDTLSGCKHQCEDRVK